MSQFVTQYTWVSDKPETNCGISIVDPSGYLPAKERIENLIRAGERLDEYRREMYDYGQDDVDDGEWMDELREPGLDYSDVHRIRQEALRRMSSQAARKENLKFEQEDPVKQASEVKPSEQGSDGSSSG